MEQIHTRLDDISRKVSVLVNRFNELKEKYAALQSENTDLKNQLRELQAENQKLTNELRTAKLVRALAPADETERAELKKKLNEYIKEIDRCVAMLND
ncbi:MAG: hypothetical protein KatS3mg031_2217 [Chitinophagales bacterium]|nr:MAG: hypothetical protein KatS3mg031_2217 [Chitinophagales bacterium]